MWPKYLNDVSVFIMEPLRYSVAEGLALNLYPLTHWGRVTHICVSKLTFIGSDNGLSPDRRQVIIWTNAGLLLIGPLGTNFSEILIEIVTFSFKKMRLKVSSAKRRPFSLGLNVLKLSTTFLFSLNFIPYSDVYFSHSLSSFCIPSALGESSTRSSA